MKPATISEARRIGQANGARRVAIIMTNGDGFTCTTWGLTPGDCRAMREWSEENADVVAEDMALATAQNKE